MASQGNEHSGEKGEIEVKSQMEEIPQVEAADNSSNDDDNPTRQTTMTRAVWLACIALCLSYTTAFQQNSCTSAIVKHIDAELGKSRPYDVYEEDLMFLAGPTNYYNWILSSYTIAVSVTLPLSGGLSDIFGRKPFFIAGTIVSLIGTAIALAAQNVPMVITGMIFKGIGSGGQQLA